MTTPTRPDARWPGLDSLRGLAVVAVVAYHLGHLSGGFLGVDVFFVLSGYLVTALALREIDRTGRLGIRAFWGRRVRRLGPALFVMVPVVLAAAVRLGWDRTDLGSVAWDATATLTWWANWRQAFGAVGGYWSAAPSLFRHAWSLGIEEQFYVLWPLVLTAGLLLARRRKRAPSVTIMLIGAVGAIGSMLWSVILAHRIPVDDLTRVYVGTDTRIAAPLLGCVLAALLHRHPLPTAGRRLVLVRALGAIASIALVVLIVRVPIDSPKLYRTGLLPAASMLAAVALAGARTLRSADPITSWLGHRSYAIYLWSWPIQVLAEHRWPHWGRWAITAFVIPLSLVLAEVSWHLIERPAQRRTVWAARPGPRRLIGSGLVAGATAAVLVITALARPVPEHRRIDTEQSVEEAVHRPPPPVTGDRSAPDHPERVLLVGDSVAWTAAFYVPAPDLPDGISTVDSRAVIGCGIMAGAGYETRDLKGEWAVAGDVHCDEMDTGIDVGLGGEPDVMLIMPGAWEGAEHRSPDGTVLPARSPAMEDALQKRLLDLAEKADAVGARTVLVQWACPGPDTDPERTGVHIPWINGVLDRTAEAGTDHGLRIAVGRPSAEVCVDADPSGAATAAKNEAMDDEVHVRTAEGGRWVWERWLAPIIRETRPVHDERVMVIGDSTAHAVAHYSPDDLPAGIASVDNRAAAGCALLAPLGYRFPKFFGDDPHPAGGKTMITADKCLRMDEAIDAGLEGEPDVIVIEFGAWEATPIATPDGRMLEALSHERLTHLVDRLLELTERGEAVGARTVLAPLACPGPRPGFRYLRTEGYPTWLDEVATEAAERARDRGLTVDLLPTPDTVCVDGDRTGDATEAKNRAMDDEVHVVDAAGGAWVWAEWWAPGIIATRAQGTQGSG